MNDPELVQLVSRLLRRAGIEEPAELTPVRNGGNNRVMQIRAGGHNLLLKLYFHDASDVRDRLASEFTFSTFAWRRGVAAVPRPIASDPDHHMAVYEFVEGRHLSPAEIEARHLDQACEFLIDLNGDRAGARADGLPTGAEACFSMDEHLEVVRKRLRLLSDVPVQSDVDQAARQFVLHDLLPAAESQLEQVRDSSRWRGLDRQVAQDSWCVSPSDFGFHNALLQPDGQLRFFDFEYAGWDDPSRAVAEFFCQIQVPAPPQCFEEFAGRALKSFPASDWLHERALLLLPVYHFKWCCIALNEFLPRHALRRQFAATYDVDERKTVQLAKARAILSGLAQPSAA